MARSMHRLRSNSDKTLLLLLFLPPIFFYIGYLNSTASGNVGNHLSLMEGCAQNNDSKQRSERRVAELMHKMGEGKDSSTIISSHKIFPPSTSDYATAMLHVSKQDLMQIHDFGVPFAPMARGSDAILIYNTPKAIPDDMSVRHDALYNGAKTSASTALSNCDSLNVIFTDTGHQRHDYNQCLVIAGNKLESYHLNRYERLLPMTQEFEESENKSPAFDDSTKLRHIPRANTHEEREDFPVPLSDSYKENGDVRDHWKKLLTFVDNVDAILDELKVIVDPIVKDNTVIVMTVNKGQSVLLSNFVCAARSRSFDISNVLVFPTDVEAQKVAKGLGLATYFDKINLGDSPEEEAAMYGDDVFASMMFAKLLTVLCVSLLGHDVLFQDVDIVWFKNPLTIFHDMSNTEIQKFDILCQDDGSVQARFAPLAANSGFYYVRANKKTQYLFTSFLYHAELVSLSGSHQQVMIQLLQEHSSLFGLTVKVFDKVETEYFPCGWQYFRRKDFMKSLVKGESNAYIYHASWAVNKDDKLVYLKQLGEWYVRDQCHKPVDEIMGGEAVDSGALASECCSAEPLITCYYSDWPSKIPCTDSPRNNPDQNDFWAD
mmetsp:Transcript_30031/g.46522  ORF Transcript_30031/g.46522 Transcript_30031/m.46522 type:complete len:602 (+) Transcript_30031:128-1933(+)